MKKSLIFVIGLVLALPGAASAASFTVTPSTGSYAVGDIITLKVAVDPAQSTVYTAMLDASFSPDIFQVVSFSLNDSMLPLKMTGYDMIDNANGLLIKTGGYTGGTSSAAPFGTLVVRAKKAGTGTITVTTGSKLLDANDANELGGSQSLAFTIAAAPVAAPSESGEARNNVAPVKPAKGENAAEQSTSTAATSTASQLLAAVAEVAASTSIATWILGLLVVALGIALLMTRRTEKGK